ncbi:MAG: sigma 54-interacting transcriptional regulator [Deltaproteobacteria bacterium]|nr:sigma 54-interacting transcriptional regulator [Deltaproteobacteria bacterium]MBW2200358.1 sigma 54-interacting transcriptional regulator [Deltaproteobacteria bacterium]
MRPKSFKSKLLIAVFTLVTSSSVLVSMLVAQRYSNSLRQRATAEAENIAHAVALEATDKILINDLVTLQKTLDYHLRSNPAIAYLFIIGNNKVLAHTFARGVPVDLISANSITKDGLISIKKVSSTTSEHFVDIAWPIFSGKAGVLRVGLSEKPYMQQVNHLWIEIAILTLGILSIALVASLLFIKKVAGPLTILAETAEKIDEGRLEQRVNIPAHGEIGMLAQSFNNMLVRIKDYTQRLEEKNLQLDRAHKQTRTSFRISQEINSLSNLSGVCVYLINELRQIVTCKTMIAAVFTNNTQNLYIHSDKGTTTLTGDPARKAYKFFAEKEQMSFVPKNLIADNFYPEIFKSCEQAVVFPIRHEGQILGAMSIACPGDCTCVTKELDVVEMILAQSSGAIRRAIAHEEEIRELRTRIEQSSEFSGLIGKDPQMQVIYKLIEDVAPTDATVLIQGESGTGKELVARAIHNNSLRKDKPFIVINCSAYPATLLESELFGHEKGAFTGAIRQKLGRFEQAHGGTVFLDEIGEISPTAQIKLLRILQSQKFERVGGENTLTVNIRILAATNKDLQHEVKAGNFREDLFYRLNVIPIQVPPLRDRRNDIPLLARYFLQKFAEEQNKIVQRFSSEAMRLLLDYDWPGNVRELENSIEHATVIAKAKYVEVSKLPVAIQQAKPKIPKIPNESDRSIMGNETNLLREVLDECNWNKKETAAKLGISRSTLYEKLKKYDITKPTIH